MINYQRVWRIVRTARGKCPEQHIDHTVVTTPTWSMKNTLQLETARNQRELLFERTRSVQCLDGKMIHLA